MSDMFIKNRIHGNSVETASRVLKELLGRVSYGGCSCFGPVSQGNGVFCLKCLYKNLAFTLTYKPTMDPGTLFKWPYNRVLGDHLINTKVFRLKCSQKLNFRLISKVPEILSKRTPKMV